MQKRIVGVIKFAIWAFALVFLIAVLGIVGMLAVYYLSSADEIEYEIPLEIENTTDEQVFVVILPIVTYEGKVTDAFSTSKDYYRIISGSPTPESGVERKSVPISKPPVKAVGKISTEQARVAPRSTCHIFYYLGKKVHFENLRIVVMVWFADENWSSVVLDMPPQRIFTLYNPDFVSGPEHYEVFAHVEVE